MLPVVNAKVDAAVLEALIIKLAARIKSRRPWPEEPAVYRINGFRVWVDTTKEKSFRRVVITTPQAPGLRVTLVDANPEKVKDHGQKVMVYVREGAAPERVGQVRLGGARPLLVMFDQKQEGQEQEAVVEGGVA